MAVTTAGFIICLILSLLVLTEAITFTKMEPSSMAIHGRKLSGSQEPRPPLTPQPQEQCRAVVKTSGTSNVFLGADGIISLHKPKVPNGTSSTARIKLSNGEESIEAGWMVDPDYYNDDEAHLYAKFTQQGGTVCFNMDCQGFVQVTTGVKLNDVPQNYSIIGGQQYTWHIAIVKSSDNGNWMLSIGDDAGFQKIIGYWPKSLFTSMANPATQVEWGGEINNLGSKNPAAEMGNGHLATYDASKSAYIQHINVVDENNHNVNPPSTDQVSDCESLYNVLDFDDAQKPYWGHTLVYGGPQSSS